MASEVHKPATTTTRAVLFFAPAVKSRLMGRSFASRTSASRTFDECAIADGAVVVKVEEGSRMFFSLARPQAARNPLPTANRGYIR
jgi:hypothetical protein